MRRAPAHFLLRCGSGTSRLPQPESTGRFCGFPVIVSNCWHFRKPNDTARSRLRDSMLLVLNRGGQQA